MNPSELKRAAKQSIRNATVNPRKLTLLYALCLTAVLLIQTLYTHFGALSLESGISGLAGRNLYGAVAWFLRLLVSLFTMMWSYHYTYYAMRLSRGEETSFRDFLTPFSRALPVLLLALLISLYTYLWSIFFIIPGIIAAYRYRFAPYIFFDHHCPASTAIRISKYMTHGYKLDLFRLDLSFLWYALPLALPSAFVMLVNMGYISFPEAWIFPYNLLSPVYTMIWYTLFLPYVESANAHAYDWVKEQHAQAEEPQQPLISE